MRQYLKIIARKAPDYLEESIGRDKLSRIFFMIDEKKSTDEIIASGVLDPQATSRVLLGLMQEKIVVPLEDVRENDGRILLVTDSASDLPLELIKERNIVVVPLTIKIDGREYLDGVDITSQQFYSLLAKSKEFPLTSPPTQEVFHQLFQSNIAERDILGIFISKRMSQTAEIANQAMINNFNSYVRQRRANPNIDKQFRIELIDSCQVSMGAALLVLEASDKIRAGWSLERIKNHIDTLVKEVKVYFMVDNLDYLARGGRIGRGSAMIGNFFGFKPILGMTAGRVDAKSRTIGGRWGRRKLIDYMKDDLGNSGRAIRIGICHADAPTKAATVQQLVEDAFPNQQNIVSYFGPTVGSHIGPGAVGVAWLALPEE